MELRKATCSDIGQIMNILDDGRASIASLGIDQWQGGYPHREVIECDVDRGESYVVVDEDGVPIGTAMMARRDETDYRIIEDGSWLTCNDPADPCYIVVHRVAVLQDSKHHGVGSYILESALDQARSAGCSSIRIDTHPGNVPMHRLLEKNGFTRCGTIRISHAEGATPERIAYEKLV